MAKNVRKIKRRDDAKPVSVQEASDEYLASAHVKRLDKATKSSYAYKLGLFARWCTDERVMLHAVDDNVIESYLQHMRATHKPRKTGKQEMSEQTLASHVRAIKTFLAWCLADEQYAHHVKAIVIQRIKQPAIVVTANETFTSAQIAALFKACEKEQSEHLQVRDRAILAMLLDTGIRATELVSLTIGNVSLDPKDAYVKVFGKGQKWGEVGLGEQAQLYLRKYIRMFREPTVEYEVEQQSRNVTERQLKQFQRQTLQYARVFVNRSGDPLTRSGLLQIIKRLSEWAEIEGVRCSPHTFRHTFAVLFWRKTHDIRTLSKLLRHSSLAVTEHYLRSIVQAEARIDAPSVLDELQ